jgi:hypothetical protein
MVILYRRAANRRRSFRSLAANESGLGEQNLSPVHLPNPWLRILQSVRFRTILWRKICYKRGPDFKLL